MNFVNRLIAPRAVAAESWALRPGESKVDTSEEQDEISVGEEDKVSADEEQVAAGANKDGLAGANAVSALEPTLTYNNLFTPEISEAEAEVEAFSFPVFDEYDDEGPDTVKNWKEVMEKKVEDVEITYITSETDKLLQTAITEIKDLLDRFHKNNVKDDVAIIRYWLGVYLKKMYQHSKQNDDTITRKDFIAFIKV
uniref:Uncharacterized protein n=1 Tax=Aplanochytrium stocchinoi TaxID=215587 RepID=A0A7S3LLQ7_9STRA|mmetsp:Transcript_10648/g.13334  ORF Transcript_10648/g.13334 Transcript_10648/m.13334 type:complete len:196 (-) Transcript_10648:377-964(-)|eukprot:CAMPEP_0204850952 /NCGR_PEP_ID=MMETSP1347-20130617/9139_1 /ASSEMBLY_ACC=CAM_ASM_000690 /TAXON_ID=215587 /ORGANISM="Aplanochytrium stocchinoi, Strain GSBS06" /LENGTH=195 /DNA_ID=CAMNT_0051994257 /DNA_START=356 /DNA_END=943 /DNA_ORIENTATION=-